MAGSRIYSVELFALRAQLVVVKDSFTQQQSRLCIDYSQTISIYTQLDAYSLSPESMI